MPEYNPYNDEEFSVDGGFNPMDMDHVARANTKVQHQNDLNQANYELAERVIDTWLHEEATLKDLYLAYLVACSAIGIHEISKHHSALVGAIVAVCRLRYGVNLHNEEELHSVTMRISGGEL